MRTVFTCLTLLVFGWSAEAQLQLANPINVKLYNNKKLKKKAQRDKARYERYIPFQLNGGMVVVQAMLNKQYSQFVLDTGAPTVLVNKKVHKDSSDTSGSDISGKLHLKKVAINQFQLGNLNAEKLEAYCLDLSHLEEVKEQKFAGMIGYNLIKDYELLIDYQRELLMLMDPSKSVHPKDLKPVGFIPFKLQKHFIVITAKVGGKKLKFGIDTGAEVNLISAKAFDKIRKQKDDNNESVNIRGLKDDTHQLKQLNIRRTIIKGNNYSDMPYVIMDMRRMNKVYGVKLDGILGYPFLASQKFSINYIDQKIYIWENAFPADNDSEQLSIMVKAKELTDLSEERNQE